MIWFFFSKRANFTRRVYDFDEDFPDIQQFSDEIRDRHNEWVNLDGEVWNNIQRGHWYSRHLGCPDHRWAIQYQTEYCNQRYSVLEGLIFNMGMKGGFQKIIIQPGCLFVDQIPPEFLHSSAANLPLIYEDKTGHKVEIPVAFYLKVDALDENGKNHSLCFLEANFTSEEKAQHYSPDAFFSRSFGSFELPEQWEQAKASLVKAERIEKWIKKKLKIREAITIIKVKKWES